MNAVVPDTTSSPALDRLHRAWTTRPRPIAGLEEIQQRAFVRAADLGLPVLRDEAWKYTSLRRFAARSFDLPAPVSALSDGDDSRWLSVPAWHRAVLVNGRVHPALSSLPATRGVRITALRELAERDPDRVTGWLEAHASGAGGVFGALNAAFLEDGVVIELDDGTELSDPIYVLHVTSQPQTAVMTHVRVVIVAGRAARAQVLEHHLSAETGESYTNCVTTAVLEETARLDHYRLQAEDRRNFHFSRFEARLGADAELRDYRLAVGAGFDRTDIDVQLAARGARASLLGLFVADLSSHVDTHTRIDHASPGTTSIEDYRGIASGRGRGVFNGKVMVRPGAQQTSAQQTNRNLLLSAGAEIDTKPELEIYADDVKCSHGATTGQLDPLALFYLRSRGIGEREARGALTRAFAATVVDRIELEPLRQRLEDSLRQRLVQEETGT